MAEYQTTLTLDLPGSIDDFIVSVRRRWSSRADGNGGLRLFISHASEDREVSDGLHHILGLFGVECFSNERDIRSGLRWPERIEDELNACEALVYLSSEHSNSSMWCQQEAAWARGRGVPVLPLPLDGSEMCGALAALQQLPGTELSIWKRPGSYNDFLRTLRARTKTVAAIFNALIECDGALREPIFDLVLTSLEKATKDHVVLCAKDILEKLPKMTEAQLARVEAVCDTNDCLKKLYDGGVAGDLRSLIKKQRVAE